ncbi:MAG: sensor histidine kinase, partial [Chitinophagaceae bacterium]
LRAKDKNFHALTFKNFDPAIGKINIIPQDIGRVLLNLFTNAFYSVAEKNKQINRAVQPAKQDYEPSVFVTTKKLNNLSSGNGDRSETMGIEIRVRDNGMGVQQKVLDKIFQPFFTTKPTGEGTGLGLSLSYEIIKAHEGQLKVETKEGEFAEFIIQLPCSA